jgi:selenocysteine lyase/cysteine desulfurase
VRTAFGERFDVPDGYLNTASIGVPPAPAADAVLAAVRGWAAGAAAPGDFDAAVATARTAFAALVGTAPERVAVGTAVSQLLAPVVAGVPDGSRVGVVRGEFTSVTFPFAARPGLRVEEVEPHLLRERAAEFDVVAVSVVQSADGAVVDLDALRAARAAGTRVVLDATQSLGWHAGDPSFADVVVAAGYKWLLSPRGCAWAAVAPDVPVVPLQAGWYAGDDPWTSVYGLPLRLAPDARALDVSPAWHAHVGAAVALPWLAGLDRAAVHAHCTGLADALRAGLGLEPAGSAIVSVRSPGALERLRAAGVVASPRAGGARLAFHLYNTHDDVATALAALR